MKPFLFLKLSFFALMVLLVNPAISQDSSAINLPPSDSLDKWLEDFNVPAIGLIALEDGKQEEMMIKGQHKKGLGASKQTLFDVASLTKSFSTHLALVLASEGKWDLAAPLYPYWVDPGVNAVMLLLPKSKRALAVFTTGDNGRMLIMKTLMSSIDVGKDILQKLN